MKLTATEKVCQGAALMLALLGFFALVALTSGCRSLFGEHTGANVIAGEHVILPEVSDATDAFAVRVFRTLKGVWFWTGKGYQLDLVYANCYTNDYFGIVTTRDCMTVKATLVPCETYATEVPQAEPIPLATEVPQAEPIPLATPGEAETVSPCETAATTNAVEEVASE